MMDDLTPNEERLAEQLAQIHERIIVDDSLIDPSHHEFDESIAESARLMQMIKLVKGVGSRDMRRDVDGTQSNMLESTLADGTLPDIEGGTRFNIPSDAIPKQVGRFKIEEPIGHGGFGIVFRGFDPQLNRPVAIKIPRLDSMLDNKSRERFVTEAKASAALIHPRIVTVFESGEYGPICYLASEFIDGMTLADWKSKKTTPLVPAAAVNLVLALADALQHAHSRGIVHRDIKPSNVLLENQPGGIDEASLAQIAKISDFGLAKIVEDDVVQTRSGSLIGTPAYMSPEQVRSDQDSIGAATDIFSLGVLFYELLTLENPFVRENLIDTMEAVQTFEPAAPGRLNSNVSRDLDAIVMKCLEKKTVNRYSSANELCNELQRYINGEPVHARKITSLSRAIRWIGRNRLATALIVALIAGMAGTSLGLVRARQAEADAKMSAANALVEAETATEVSEFLEEMFQSPDLLGGNPGEKRGRDITVEEFLKHGANKIRGELEDQPKVKARLMATIGSILVRLGVYEEAETLLRDAMKLRQGALDEDDPELAHGHRHLGRLYMLHAKPAEAEREFRAAIKLLEVDEVKNHRELSGTLNDLGRLLKRSRPDEAIASFNRARKLTIAYRPNPNEVWALDANLAGIDARAGRFELARQRFEDALEMGKQFHGTDTHPSFGAIYSNLAFVHRKLGNYNGALELQQLDLKLAKEKLGDGHLQVGIGLVGITGIYQRLGEYENAAATGEKAIEILEATLPKDNPMIGVAISNHAVTLLRLKDFGGARELVEQLNDRLANRNDDDSIASHMRQLLLLATIERQDGNIDRSLEIIETVLDNPKTDGNPGTGMDARFAKSLALAKHSNELAEESFEKAITFAKTVSGLQPRDLAYFVARYRALIGDKEIALLELEKAFEFGFCDALILTDPDIDSLRDDSRFSTLVSKIETILAKTN